MGRRRVTEFGTTGVDEALQGLTSSPYPTRGTPSYLGLRIPDAIGGTPATNRYLFCLATFSTKGGRIRGIRQALTIGFGGGANIERPVKMWVVTPDFRFSDGNVSWHLVKEPSQRLVNQIPTTDAQSWAYLQSQSPAMLYKTFTNSNVVPGTFVPTIGNGRPVIYDQGLTAYTPPDVSTNWTGIGGLGVFYDLRFPWHNANAWNAVDIPVDSGWYSFYASVLQTNPGTRQTLTYPTAPTSGDANANLDFGAASPEEAFVGNWAAASGEGVVNPGIRYWSIAGSLILEDTG